MEAIIDFQEVSKADSGIKMSTEYQGIKIPETLKSEIRRKIVLYFEEQKVYLDSHLTLAKLSSMIGTNTAYLSSMVNYVYKCNLPTLINHYRIGYAKQLMGIDNINIKDVYTKCGFVSRSAFYKAFQKETGTTPSIFVKQLNR